MNPDWINAYGDIDIFLLMWIFSKELFWFKIRHPQLSGSHIFCQVQLQKRKWICLKTTTIVWSFEKFENKIRVFKAFDLTSQISSLNYIVINLIQWIELIGKRSFFHSSRTVNHYENICLINKGQNEIDN